MGLKNIKIQFRRNIQSLKAPFAIYLDLECLLKKEQSCENNNNNNNNIEESYTEKKAKHEPYVYKMFI